MRRILGWGLDCGGARSVRSGADGRGDGVVVRFVASGVVVRSTAPYADHAIVRLNGRAEFRSAARLRRRRMSSAGNGTWPLRSAGDERHRWGSRCRGQAAATALAARAKGGVPPLHPPGQSSEIRGPENAIKRNDWKTTDSHQLPNQPKSVVMVTADNDIPEATRGTRETRIVEPTAAAQHARRAGGIGTCRIFGGLAALGSRSLG